MKLQISTSSPEPIYRQLTQQIRSAVAQGQLKPESQLPSVRELSRQLVVNPNTVARAYTELERDGVLHTRQGLGVFVAQPSTELTKSARMKQLLEPLDEWLTTAVYLGFEADEVRELVSERIEKYQWDLVKGKSS